MEISVQVLQEQGATFMALKIIELLLRWDNLHVDQCVWDNDEALNQYCRGLLRCPMAKQVYSWPSKVMIDAAFKNKVVVSASKL